LGREINHSPPSVKNGWSYTSASFVRHTTSAEILPFRLLYIKLSLHNFSRKTSRDKTLWRPRCRWNWKWDVRLWSDL